MTVMYLSFLLLFVAWLRAFYGWRSAIAERDEAREALRMRYYEKGAG